MKYSPPLSSHLCCPAPGDRILGPSPQTEPNDRSLLTSFKLLQELITYWTRGRRASPNPPIYFHWFSEDILRKNPALYISILKNWLLCLMYQVPHMSSYQSGHTSPFNWEEEQAAIVVYSVCLFNAVNWLLQHSQMPKRLLLFQPLQLTSGFEQLNLPLKSEIVP